MVMQRTWDNWKLTNWKREDQAKSGGVNLPQLQARTCMSSMNNKEKYNGYYRYYLNKAQMIWVQLTYRTSLPHQAAVESEKEPWLGLLHYRNIINNEHPIHSYLNTGVGFSVGHVVQDQPSSCYDGRYI